MPFLFDRAKMAEGIEVRIPEAALPKKDLLFMIIVFDMGMFKVVQADTR